MKLIYVLTLISCTLIATCGPNPYKTLEKKDPAEDATVALENDDPQKAIDILTAALGDSPGNIQYMSILALAYAQRAGVDPLTLAQKMGSSSSSTGSSSGNGVTSLFGVMPPATQAAIDDVDAAIALLVAIPSAQRGSYDVLKLAMFQTASMTLRSKMLDTDGDGVLSPSELLAMSTSNAAAILSQLAAAAGAFAGGSSTSATDQAASEQISKISAAIAAEPGATDADKLKSYLAKTSG
jgi:hypothetical protein